jgi:hypothetical protein
MRHVAGLASRINAVLSRPRSPAAGPALTLARRDWLASTAVTAQRALSPGWNGHLLVPTHPATSSLVLPSDPHASTAPQGIKAVSPGLTTHSTGATVTLTPKPGQPADGGEHCEIATHGVGWVLAAGWADPAGSADIVMKSRPQDAAKKVAGPCTVEASRRWPFVGLASPPGSVGS